MTKSAQLTIQQWGNSVGVRIPSRIAKAAHFVVGTPVEVELQEVGVAVKPIGKRRRTLDEMLDLFDSKKHGEEVMVARLVGKEIF